MVALMDLWLPILLAAVFVFVASSIIHMALPIHKSDYGKLPDEAELLEAMRGRGVKPGAYAFPSASSMKEMGTPEHIEKMNEGPVGFMTIMPNGPMAMGKYLTWWFLYSVVISIFVGYIGTLALAAGEDGAMVFRVTGTVAILGYAIANATDSIWKGVSWWVTAKFFFDGIVYGLATAAAFAWFWPAA